MDETPLNGSYAAKVDLTKISTRVWHFHYLVVLQGLPRFIRLHDLSCFQVTGHGKPELLHLGIMMLLYLSKAITHLFRNLGTFSYPLFKIS